MSEETIEMIFLQIAFRAMDTGKDLIQAGSSQTADRGQSGSFALIIHAAKSIKKRLLVKNERRRDIIAEKIGNALDPVHITQSKKHIGVRLTAATFPSADGFPAFSDPLADFINS